MKEAEAALGSSELLTRTQKPLWVREEPALECCLGNYVHVCVQVKACCEMTFASGVKTKRESCETQTF